MVYRFTQIASAALLVLVIARLARLFLPTEGGLPWPLALVIAIVLAATTTLAAIKARLGPAAIVITNVLVYLAFILFYVGSDVTGSIVPTPDNLSALATEFADAITVFRYATPPVAPLPGLIALAAGVMWSLTMFSVWGLWNGSPYLAIVPPVVFYLQLAVIDRSQTGSLWTLMFLLLLGGGLAAVVADQGQGGGHAGHGRQRTFIRAVTVPLVSILAVSALAFYGSRAAEGAVPSSGILEWRNRAGLGGGFGGSVSYNPFIDVRRSLVSQTDAIVFQAQVTGDVNPTQLYFQLLTMDSFNGDWWYSSEPDFERLEESGFEADEFEFRGPTESIVADVAIQRLVSQFLPVPYAANALVSDSRLIEESARVSTLDGSVKIDGTTDRGMRFAVRSDVPVVDIRALASGGGELSPLFDRAAKAGLFQRFLPPSPTVIELSDEAHDRYTELPLDRVAPSLRSLAGNITLGLETDFEKAIALENFFRFDSSFTYSTAVAPSERDTGLADWLTDATTPGYRIGYCEQFAASMAVLARLLDIPSRTVLGFTPGTVGSDGAITVRDRNAHAWVELWLPSQGWVRFDPTPRADGVNPTTLDELPFTQSTLTRFLSEIETEAREAANESGGANLPPGLLDELDNPDRFAGVGGGESTTDTGFRLTTGWLRAIAALGLVPLALAIVPLLKRSRTRKRRRRLAEGDITAAWAEIVDHLTDARIGPRVADTPIELAAAIDPAMFPLAEVYTEAAYGPNGKKLDSGGVAVATTSLRETKQLVDERSTRWSRLRRLYRLDSVKPSWMAGKGPSNANGSANGNRSV